MIRANTEWALGLHAYSQSQDCTLFSEFYALTSKLLGDLGASPNWIGAEGSSFSGKLTKLPGRTFQKLLNTNFKGISVLALVTADPADKEPSYDRSISATLSFNANNEILLCFVVNEGICQFRSAEFYKIVTGCLQLGHWDFGFAFADLVSRQQEFHILSLDPGNLTLEEQKALTKWYQSPPSERLRCIRSVYPVNIVNDRQLNQSLDNGNRLRDFILSISGSTLNCVAPGKDLYIWEMPEKAISGTKAKLKQSSTLLT
jgi:hypothetical protein